MCMGPAAARAWAKGRRGALAVGLGPAPTTGQGNKAPGGGGQGHGHWPMHMPNINGHGPARACAHALGFMRTGQGAKGARGMCWQGRVLMMGE